MNEWIDKPDGDGLWWYSGTMNLYEVCSGKGRWAEGRLTHVTFDIDRCPEKWHRADITKPAPYVPQQPPKVEWFTAKSVSSRENCFAVRIVDRYFVFTSSYYKGNWTTLKDDFTDITPCDQANTTSR